MLIYTLAEPNGQRNWQHKGTHARRIRTWKSFVLKQYLPPRFPLSSAVLLLERLFIIRCLRVSGYFVGNVLFMFLSEGKLKCFQHLKCPVKALRSAAPYPQPEHSTARCTAELHRWHYKHALNSDPEGPSWRLRAVFSLQSWPDLRPSAEAASQGAN